MSVKPDQLALTGHPFTQTPGNMDKHVPKGYRRVFTRYITRNGKRIYPRNGKVFSFLVREDASTRPR